MFRKVLVDYGTLDGPDGLVCDQEGNLWVAVRAENRPGICVYSPEGVLAARYDKMHLFRYDNGRESYDEGRVLQAGSEPAACQVGDLRLGLSICYRIIQAHEGRIAVDSVPNEFCEFTLELPVFQEEPA